MCIVFYTVAQPRFKLILAANRDEFLDRPTTHAHWHNFDHGSDGDDWILCGQDLGNPGRGTWLGMTRDLRVGVLTNVRYPLLPPPPQAPSRGVLLKHFLLPPPDEAPKMHSFLDTIDPSRYTGFNLLLFDLHDKRNDGGDRLTSYVSNRSTPPILCPDHAGCKGMSNSPWEEPYPKVLQGEERMANELAEWTQHHETDDQLVERMMSLLSPAPPVRSPEDMTRATSIAPIKLVADETPDMHRWYGTRVATVILVKDSGEVIFVERDRFVLNGGEVQDGSAERREVFQADVS